MKEEYLRIGPLEPTNEPNTIATIAAIKMGEAYNCQCSTRYRSVMPPNLHGPSDSFHLENSRAIPAMTRKLHLAKLAMQVDLKGLQQDDAKYGQIPLDIKQVICLKPDSSNFIDDYNPSSVQSSTPSPYSLPKVVLWGTGQARREFLHVDDMAAACVFVMGLDQSVFSLNSSTQTSTLIPEPCQSSPHPLVLVPSSSTPNFVPSFLNIGTGQDQTIAATAELVGQVVCYEGEIFFDTTKPDGTPRKLIDSTRLQALGWRSTVPLKDGLILTYMNYLRLKRPREFGLKTIKRQARRIHRFSQRIKC